MLLETCPKKSTLRISRSWPVSGKKTSAGSCLLYKYFPGSHNARRRLSVKELQLALAVSPGRPGVLDYVYREHILTAVCAGLVVIDTESRIIRGYTSLDSVLLC
jgi:hypothetical protein